MLRKMVTHTLVNYLHTLFVPCKLSSCKLYSLVHYALANYIHLVHCNSCKLYSPIFFFLALSCSIWSYRSRAKPEPLQFSCSEGLLGGIVFWWCEFEIQCLTLCFSTCFSCFLSNLMHFYRSIGTRGPVFLLLWLLILRHLLLSPPRSPSL